MTLGQTAQRSSQVSFYGHETFPFRHSWLTKGVNAVSQKAEFFSSERAMIELGVGKNMVQAIRYWCLALHLICEDATAGARSGRYVPTEFGRSVFVEGGFDPYMEDPATLWLLQWNLASNLKQATTWFWMFNYWLGDEFTKEKALREIQSWLDGQGYKAVSANSLKRDVDCFVRTYVNSRQTKTEVVEDSLDCPLVDLRLIAEIADDKTYQFQRGAQASLPDEVLAIAVVDFWRGCDDLSNSLAFAKIAFDPGSPGRIFKLDEDTLAGRLEKIESLTEGALYYDETSGLKQVYRRASVEPIKLLKSYYQPKTLGATSTK